MLQLQIKSGEVDMDAEADTYIRERAAHLDQFYDSILTCRVMVEAPVGHHRQGGPFDVRIDLDVPGSVISVTHQTSDKLHVAIRQAFEAAQRQLEDYARKQRGEVSPVVPPPRGKVARVFAEKGYGFLEADDGHEIYFHRNSVIGGSFERLKPGDEVRYAEELGEKGPQASTVAIGV